MGHWAFGGETAQVSPLMAQLQGSKLGPLGDADCTMVAYLAQLGPLAKLRVLHVEYGSDRGMRALAVEFASRGFVAFNINYRKHPDCGVVHDARRCVQVRVYSAAPDTASS